MPLTPLIPAIVIAVLLFVQSDKVFEPFYLLPLLNTVFLGIIPLVIAFHAARVFSDTGKSAILLLGCAMMSLGVGGLISGWMIMGSGGVNAAITIYNCGMLASSMFHFAAGLVSIDFYKDKVVAGRRSLLAVAYALPAVLLIIVSFAADRGLTSLFIIQGRGPTTIGRTVLNTGIILLAASYCIASRHYRTSRLPLFKWYSTGLGLFVVGLTGVFLQHSVGSLIGWAGRISQYAGAVCLLAGMMRFTGSVKRKGLDVSDAIAFFFKDARANYEALVETASDGIISLNNQGRILLWNNGAKNLFGYNREEAEGKVFVELIRPEGADATHFDILFSKGTETSQAGTAGSKTLYFEATVTDNKGSRFPAEFSISRRETANGTVTTCIIRDISERKRTEHELEESNQYLRSLVNASPLAIIAMNPEGVVTLWNHAAENMFGWQANEAIGQFLPIVSDEDKESHHALRERVLDGKGFTGIEVCRRRKNGNSIDISVSTAPIINYRGEITGIMSVSMDITDRKRIEDALRISEERFSLAVKAAQEGVWDWNMETDEVWYSKRYKEMLGYSEDEIEHHLSAWSRLVHPDDKEPSLKLIDEVMQGRRNYEIEFRLRHKDGHYLDILSRSYPIRRESDGKIL